LILQQSDALVSEREMDGDAHTFSFVALDFNLAAVFANDSAYD
jgi:hypothetical protein